MIIFNFDKIVYSFVAMSKCTYIRMLKFQSSVRNWDLASDVDPSIYKGIYLFKDHLTVFHSQTKNRILINEDADCFLFGGY